MVGSINNGYQQQASVFRSLNPGVSRDQTEQNQVQQNRENTENSEVSSTQSVDRVGAQREAQPVLRVGEDTGLSPRSSDRGQNLDISV